MDTLLKKKDSRITKQIKVVKTQMDDASKITYICNAETRGLTFPATWDYPLKKSIKTQPVKPVLCGVCNNNLKKYSCSKTGKPLCSLSCYKVNLQLTDLKIKA